MTAPAPAVSVVVCAYTMERADQVRDAVVSALAQEPPPAEVVVVIDHNQALLDHLRDRVVPALEGASRVRLVESTGTPGLSGARNTGVDASNGDVVAFLDDDAVARPGWLAALVAPFARDADVAGTGGTTVPVWDGGGRPRWFPPEFDWVVGCTYRGTAADGEAIRNPLGCNMAFRRGALALVGGFRSDVGRVGTHPAGCEETELCIRLRQRSPRLRFVMAADAVVDHHVADERHRFAYFRRRCFAEGVSKAVVSRQVGAADALSSERSYVARTLTSGAGMALRDGARDLDPAGAQRFAAIVLGAGFTLIGYLRGRWVSPASRRSSARRTPADLLR